jgi:hypothetical protein
MIGITLFSVRQHNTQLQFYSQDNLRLQTKQKQRLSADTVEG